MSMSTKERGILIGLAIVLAAGTAYIVIKAGEQRRGDPSTADEGGTATFNTERLPDLGTPIREYDTPGGVTVQVYTEGEGEPVGKGQAMDIDYVGYSAKSGSIFERGTYQSLVLERRSVITGWLEGLQGIRLREKRRLLIPSEMAYGQRRSGNIRPGSDLVFDVRWVRLEIEDAKVGTGKTARRGQQVLVHYVGAFENGKIFDSSYQHKPPEPLWMTLRTPGVIQGWTQGIPGMQVGGRRKLWIPWKLAYGEAGKSPIPPYTNLEFVVELLDVK